VSEKEKKAVRAFFSFFSNLRSLINYGKQGSMEHNEDYVIEMLHITKEFPGIVANDDITLRLRRGEIHALLGENGAGKSTLMSVLFGLYQPEKGEIHFNGKKVEIRDPNDATALGIGMVHQHFKLVEVFTVLDNIILGAETTKFGFLRKAEARKKVEALEEKYGLHVDLDAKVEDITVGMQQRVEILKMLYRDNNILIFDEPTAVLTPQEIDELMDTMRGFAAEGKSILFISHKLNEIMQVSDRITVLRKGKYVGTIDTAGTNARELSNMMVGRPVQLEVVKEEAKPTDVVLSVKHFSVPSHVHKGKNAVTDVSFDVRKGEIVCLAGIDGNGQTELVRALVGLDKASGGTVTICGKDVTAADVKTRAEHMSHIPEDRHRHGLVLDFTLEENMVLQRFKERKFQHNGFINRAAVRKYSDYLIDKFDVRSGQGSLTTARAMSGGNQQKAIIARELDRDKDLIVAVQPTRGLDVGAIEFIHAQLVAERDKGKAILLVSLELDEVLSLSDRILVLYEGEVVGEFQSKQTNAQELGLYMSGAKRMTGKEA
jgi:simple sugar transport system ATP-binding protein